MTGSGTIVQRARRLGVAMFVATGGLAACGDTNEESAAGVPHNSGSSGPAATTTTLPSDVFEGVTVAQSQASDAPHDWWWVIDLAGSTTIDGSGRVLVEIPQSEVGCGESMRPIDTFQLGEGASVSFELIDGAPGERPTSWFTEAVSFDSEPAVRGRQFRVECPPGTEEVAAELAAQRATWEQAGVDSYEFTMGIEVFGPLYGAYRIVVVDDAPVSMVREDESEAPLPAELPGTIDAVFDLLERSVSADRFVATYDPDLGYPRSVTIDHILNAIDDELAVHVTSLTPSAR
jgi:hypothetical protein